MTIPVISKLFVDVATAGLPPFSTKEGVPEIFSFSPDINPSNIDVTPVIGETVLLRISSSRNRASHDETHTNKIPEKIIIVKKREKLFLK